MKTLHYIQQQAFPEQLALPAKQRGAVLVVSLLLLLILTILALTTSQTALLQEKMTGSVRDSHIAFLTAEAAVTDAEKWIADNIKTQATVDAAFKNGVTTPGRYDLRKDSGVDKIDWYLNASNDKWGDSLADGDTNANTILSESAVYTGGEGRYYIEYGGKRADGSAAEKTIILYNAGYSNPVGAKDNVHVFTIVARGQGKRSDTYRIIRSTFGKKVTP